jgi:RNA recognition motif-containing protein
MTQKEFYNIFLEYGDIVSGKIEYDENGISKGFGYIYYYSEESAENAKKNLNGKTFFGKPLEIVNLITGKKNKSNSINLFVLNIPKDITEEKLRSIFEQFGPVSNISVNPKGFAYISYNNFDSASRCLNQMKVNPISFPGLSPVVVKYAVSKEERESNKNFINNYDRNDFVQSNLTIQFNYNFLYYKLEIKTELDLDKEIRLFIKVIMIMDYSPKEVLEDLESMSGIVIFEKYADYNFFLTNIKDFVPSNPHLLNVCHMKCQYHIMIDKIIFITKIKIKLLIQIIIHLILLIKDLMIL